MHKYTGYIVDDENLARYSLRKKLASFPEIEIVGETNNIQDAKEEITGLLPDILFLDIQLNKGTGFDLLNLIDYKGKVVFITAFDEYAIRAFEINAVDYLLKPISNKRLAEAINRVKGRGITRKIKDIVKFKYDDRLLVSTNNSMSFIKISDITHIRSSGDYTELIISDGNVYLESRSMVQWEKCLPDNHFCRISRFYIVNFDFIQKIKKKFSVPGLLYIEGREEPVKISKYYYRYLREKYR